MARPGTLPLPDAAGGRPALELSEPSQSWDDYALLDSGGRLKLEQVGPYRIVRPELRAPWTPRLPKEEWERADAVFHAGRDPNRGRWELRRRVPERWPVHYRDLRFWAQLTPFRHIGFFPEQAPQWDWIRKQVKRAGAVSNPVQVLNLFGYTGVAALAASAAGAQVTHVDASRKAVTWARENQRLSSLDDRPIRWIVDDALKFALREQRRGRRYEGFVLDPPPFGHGPDGELWKLDRSLPAMLAACRALFSDHLRFVVVTVYATSVMPGNLRAALAEAMRGRGGRAEVGACVLVERSAGRSLPCAYYARWRTTS